MTYTFGLPGRVGDLCVFLQSWLNTPRERYVSANGCFDRGRGARSIELALQGGRRVTVERLSP